MPGRTYSRRVLPVPGSRRPVPLRRRSIALAAGRNKPRRSNFLIEFFDDITEGARTGPRRRSPQDVPEFTDLSGKAWEAAGALQGLWGEAWDALDSASDSWGAQLSSIKQDLAEGKKDVATVVDEVLDSLVRDITRLLGPLFGSNSAAEASVNKVLASATSKGTSLKKEVQQGAKTAAQAADELRVIVRTAFDDIRSLLLSSGAAEASSNVAGVAAEAAAAISDALARDRPAGALLQIGQLQDAMSALNRQMPELTTLATKLQQQAAAGKLPAGEAVEQVLSAFLSLLGPLRGSLTASGGSAGSSKALAALDHCQEQANAGARMVQQAASKQGGVAPDAAVQHLATLLVQLAADLSAELVALGPADAAAAAKVKFELPAGFSSSRAGSAGGSRQASGGQQAGGVQLGDALQELQGVLAGGVDQGLAAAGGAIKEAVTAVADFLSFLFGRVDSAAASVRSGGKGVDAEVVDVLAAAMSRAESLKQSLAGLPDAKMVQAAHREIDAAVAVLKRRLEGLQSDVRGNRVSSDEALKELSAAMSDLAAQLQSSLQFKVFGDLKINLPTFPTGSSSCPPKGASGLTGSRSTSPVPAPVLGALNSAAKILNGFLSSADGNGTSSSSKPQSTTTKASAAPATQQLAAGVQKAGQALSGQAQQVAAQAKGAAAQAKGVAADASRAAGQAADAAQKAAASAAGDVDQIFADLTGKAEALKASVASGKTDASVVVNDAVSQLKSKADALKKTAAGKNPDAAAAIDAAVAGFEAKAEALKSAVASGKADASLALDETLSGLASKADELKQLAASGDMDNAVKELTGKAEALKASVASGKTDASVVVNDAVSQLKSKADALKKTAAGKNPDAAAAIDAAVAGFEAKAEALKSAVASGKADASLALDETLSGLASKADELKQLAASGDMDNAVKELTGKLAALKAKAASGSPFDASAALDSLLFDFNQKLSKSVSMLGGPDSPAAAALQAALLPISDAAKSVKATLASPEASAPGFDLSGLFDQLTAAVGDASSNLADGVGAASAQVLELKAAARTLVAAEGLVGSLEGALKDLKGQLKALGSAPAGSEAAEEARNLFRASVDEVVAQLGQLKLTGLASMDEESDAGGAHAAATAALDELLAKVQARGEALAGQVQAGQVKGAVALEELLLVVKDSTSGDLRSAVLDILSVEAGSGDSEALAAQLEAVMEAARPASTGGFDGALAIGKTAGWLVNVVVGVAALQLVKGVTGTVLQQAGIVMPSALGGMLGLCGLLTVFGPRAGDEMVAYYDKHLAWTSKLLPLFYVPALAVLPVLMHGMPGDDVAALLSITAAGAITSLVFAAKAAVTFIPKAKADASDAAASAQEQDPAAVEAATARRNAGLAVAALAALAPLALTKHNPAAYGELMTIPAGLAWPVFGWLAAHDWKAGGVPGSFLLNPMVVGALSANLGVMWHGRLAGVDYVTAMHQYLGQGFGAGDIIMSCVGTALTGLAFVIYKHRASISVPAVAGTALLSSVFSVMATLGASNLLGVTAGWTKALLPRHVTDVLATDVARTVGASISNTGLAVLLQAAMTVALGGIVFRALGASSAAKGAAAGCTAGAIGAAGLSDEEPVALANGGLAYAIVGVVSYLVLQLPALREALVTVAATAV